MMCRALAGFWGLVFPIVVLSPVRANDRHGNEGPHFPNKDIEGYVAPLTEFRPALGRAEKKRKDGRTEAVVKGVPPGWLRCQFG
jgi:hypothetical protein